MKNTAPWLLVLVALLAVAGVRPGGKPAEDKKEKKEAAAEESPPGEEAATSGEDDGEQEAPAAPPSWCDPARRIADFAGLTLDCQEPSELKGLFAKSAPIHFYIALVPDPIDTPLPALFDQAINGLQTGFAQSGYLFDRYWLPWLEQEAKDDKRYREAPGILLFRHQDDLAAVLVVGETPKGGLHRKALAAGLSLISSLWSEPEHREVGPIGPEVGIFGPTFSGTAPSLQKALATQPAWTFRIATGSATAAGLEAGFADVAREFCRTVIPDDALLHRAAGFLTRSMGWNLKRVALLHEADTAYGMPFGDSDRMPMTFLPFPSHLSDLRNVRRTAAEPSAEETALEGLWKPSRPVMDLNLIDRERSEPVDRVRAFSSLSPVADDLVLSNILETISREEFRYVGILATDTKDKLFLAEEVRRYAPGTVLFSLDNNLLYAHPKLSGATDGMIVISSYPLFTEGAPWLPSATSSERSDVRRQYGSDFEQGLVAAVRYLLGAKTVGEPTAWVGVVSNGSIWPLARLPVAPKARASFAFCGTGRAGAEAQEEQSWASKVNLQLLALALLVVVLARWLKKSSLITDVEGVSRRPIADNRWLLIIGLVVLTLAASILLVLATMPILVATGFFTRGTLSRVDLLRWLLFMVGLFAIYSWLVRTTVRVAPSKRDGDTVGEWLKWIAVAIAVHLLVGLALYWWWVPAGKEGLPYAYLRVVTFSSGLSPLVSLGLLVGGGYVWLLNEMKRRLLVARQAVRCPVAELGEPALAGADRLLAQIARWTDTTLPSKSWLLWLLPAVLFLPPALLLWSAIQPIAESQSYGRYFLCLLIAMASLTALSFCRFWVLWRQTQRLLVRLDVASPELQKAFAKLGAELEWKPMKSFALRIPPFRGLLLSVRKLEGLARRVKVEVEERPEAFDRPLGEILEHAGREELEPEIAARWRLEAQLDRGVAALAQVANLPEAREALALRVAVYLRYVFSHMRSTLIGAVLSGLLALVAVHFYQFEPKQFVSLALWMLFSLAVLSVLWVFVSMDRNPTLSRMGGTKPGAVTLDTAFVSNLLTYVALPVLGLVGTQVSAVGNLVRPILDQVLRVLGGG